MLSDGLVRGTLTPVLLGARCDTCAAYQFPRTSRCRRCAGAALTDCELGDRGRLWSWTVQRFPPKAPYLQASSTEFREFGVGYVHMDNTDVMVEARLLLQQKQALTIGMKMRLCLETLGEDEQGNPLNVYAFEPENGQ